MGAQALFLPICPRMKKEKSEKHTWYLVRYMQEPNRLHKSEVRASVLCVKTPCEQGHVRATSRATPSFCDGEGEAQFPHGTWTHCEAPPCGIRSVRSGLGQRSFRSFLCPTPKVTPRSSLGDVGEARWPLSHRWADTSSTSPDAAHDSRNQAAWCRSLMS